MKEKQLIRYLSPQVEMTEFSVEEGFAQSSQGAGLGNFDVDNDPV